MVLLGTIANVLAVIVGSLIGLVFTNIHERYKETIMHGIGLTVLIIGIQMALGTESIIVVLLSMLTGALIGEAIQLEDRINRFAERVSRQLVQSKDSGGLAQAFVAASLIFVVGAMAILGALDSGMRGDHGILYTKSILDGFTALVLTSTLGIGVILSAFPIFIYQGSISLLALKINEYVPDAILHSFITEVTAVGGILIIAIGLNLLGLMKIRISNLLPALITVLCFVYGQALFFH